MVGEPPSAGEQSRGARREAGRCGRHTAAQAAAEGAGVSRGVRGRQWPLVVSVRGESRAGASEWAQAGARSPWRMGLGRRGVKRTAVRRWRADRPDTPARV